MEQGLRKSEFKSFVDQLQTGSVIKLTPDSSFESIGVNQPLIGIVTAVNTGSKLDSGDIQVEIAVTFYQNDNFQALPNDVKDQMISDEGITSIFTDCDDFHLLEILASSVWDLLRNQINL